MSFTVSRNVNWKMSSRWEYALDLVKLFNKKFSLEIKQVASEHAKEFTFFMDSSHITFYMYDLSSSITLCCSGSKEDFDEKYDFVFNNLLKDKVE